MNEGLKVFCAITGGVLVILVVTWALALAGDSIHSNPNCAHSCPQGTFVSKCESEKYECAAFPAGSVVLPETRIEVR